MRTERKTNRITLPAGTSTRVAYLELASDRFKGGKNRSIMDHENVFRKAISGKTWPDVIALVARTSRSILRVMRVNVVVKPKEAVLDPQGAAVRDAMRHLGMPEVRGVRIGKYMEIDIEGEGADVEERLHGLCRDLLSNPVIEDYELQPNAPRKQATKKRGEKK